MNVIFLDFDGVIDTNYYKSDEDVENKIKILADICHKFDCKVVIEASAKSAIDEDTLNVNSDATWVKFIFDMFKKYKIECIGRTPCVGRKITDNSYSSLWKEDEIRLYLYRHPEIDHYCIIDDDDLRVYNRSDLNTLREHVLLTYDYLIDTPEEEGILKKHEVEIENILKKENDYKKYALKRINKTI